MASSIKAPPTFNEGDDYLAWKNDITVWEMFTDVAVEKKGPAVYLSLKGKAREAVREIAAAELAVADGLKKITERLDTIYLKDKNTQAYLNFKEFYEYKRSHGETFNEFVVKFELLYNKLTKYEMTLPEGVKAFFLLNAANFTEENEKLARATVGDLTYTNMKEKCKKIFGDCTVEDDNGTPQIKGEVLYGSTGSGGARSRYKEGRGGSNRRFSKKLRCYECDSTQHLAYDCPRRQKYSDSNYQHKGIQGARSTDRKWDTEQIHITLLSSKTDGRMSNLVAESLGMAVIDSGCTKNVAGITWVNAYLETLSEEQQSSVEKSSTSKVTFKFGDGKEVQSIRSIKFPAKIGDKCYFIQTEVVDNDIPLLLSREAMKRGNMVINFKDDTITIDDCDVVKLFVTTTGHYCVPLNKFQLSTPCSNIILHGAGLANLTKKEKYQKAEKLHRQFSHASKEKLVKLVKSSKYSDKEFLDCIEQCCDDCTICQRYKKAPLRPVVSMPIANDFNQVVCMDLKEHVHHKYWILHLIDSATRYSAACLINTKHKDTVIKKVFQIWIAYFGCPGKILTDNGGEFSNDLFREMNEKLNVITWTTAGESPFSNGTVERHNKTLYEAMMKTIEDAKCSPEVALAWSVSAKNALQNNNGFSPNQLVFGHNVNFPTVLSDKLPALEGTTSSDIIRSNLQALHSARKNFIKAESSDRIRKALRHQVRTYSDVQYVSGDKVFYRRKNFKGWKGPGVVLGQDGKFVLVRHGGAYYRVHPCQLMKVNHQGREAELNSSSSKQTSKQTSKQKSVALDSVTWTDSDDSDLGRREGEAHSSESEPDEDEDDEDDHTEDENDGEGNPGDGNNEDQHADGDDENLDADGVDMHEDDQGDYEDATVENPTVDELSVLMDEMGIDEVNVIERPKPKSYVKFKLDGNILKGTVLSMQPKRTGRNKDWVNLQLDGGDEPIGVNWRDVEGFEVLPNSENVVYYSKIDEFSQEVVDAKDREFETLIANDVIDVVPDKGQEIVSTKWVFTEKIVENQKVVKARLVARGFEEMKGDLRTDSPTCSRQGLRILFIAIVNNGWTLSSLDVSSAFLQGNRINRDIFLKPPSEMCPDGMLWKLKRCLYGLNDAPREWYKRVKDELVKLDGKLSAYDNAMYLWHVNNELLGILISHVDDMLYGGTGDWQKKVIDHFQKVFKIKCMEQGAFKYIGINVVQMESEIIIDQTKYIGSITPIQIADDRMKEKDDKLTAGEMTSLRSASGQLLWVTGMTRPDMAFYSCQVSNYGKDPTVRKLIEANKIIRNLQSTKVYLKFPKLGSQHLQVLCYSDASHANLPTGASQGAFIVFLSGNGKVAPVAWRSKRLSRVTKSPLASETLALGEAADTGYLIASMVQEVFALETLPPIKGFTDNKSLQEMLYTTHIVQDARLRVDVARLREMIERKEIEVSWVPKERQIADVMTKQGASGESLLEVFKTSKIV